MSSAPGVNPNSDVNLQPAAETPNVNVCPAPSQMAKKHPAPDYIHALFQPDDLIAVMLLRGKETPIHWFATVSEVASTSYLGRLRKKNEEGFNIYVCMNPLTAKRRVKENVSVIRTLYLDLDENGSAALQKIQASVTAPKPSFILESSPEKFQVIWSVDGIQPAEQEVLLGALIQEFGGDPAASDMTRVLRLPGFINHKYESKPVVQIVENNFNGDSYTREVFKINVNPAAAETRIPFVAPDEIYEGEGRNNAMMRLASSLRAKNLADSAVYAAVVEQNRTTCHPPLEDNELKTVVKSALRSEYKAKDAKRRQEKNAATSAANLPGNPPAEVRPGQKINPWERKAQGESIFRMGNVVVPKRIKWFWPNRVPSGKITLFAGNPDNAKSLVSSWLAATCTVGRPFPDAPNPLPPSEVLMLLGEDDLEDTAITRLMAAGADISKVHFMEAVRPTEGDERDIRLDWDLVRIEQRLKEHPNIRLIIIDPISNYLGEVSMVAEQDVRSVLIPLKRLAAKYTVAVITIMHLNKKADLEAICRVGGAMAFIGVARCSWLFVRDEDENEDGAQKNSDTFSMLRIKNNLARVEKNGLSYEVLVERVTTSDGDELVPYIHWLGAAVKKNANEVLGSGRRDRGRPKHQDSDLDSAKRWLQDQLQDGQPHSGKALLEAAKEGEGIKNFKLREAAKSLKVDIYKDGVAWFWRMPPVRATSATISQGEPSKRSGFLEVA